MGFLSMFATGSEIFECYDPSSERTHYRPSHADVRFAGYQVGTNGRHRAEQLGVSKRTLYEMFGDKEGLLYLAMERYSERNRQRWNELTADAHDVLEAMFMVLGEVMDNAEVSRRMMDNLKKFYPAVHDKLMREGMVKNRTSLRSMLEQGIEAGLFVNNFNIDLSISVLYYTASAIVTRRELMLPDGMSEREAFVQIISNFFRGISTAKGLQLIDDNLKRYRLSKTGNKLNLDR